MPKIAAIQHAAGADKAACLDKTIAGIRQAAEQGAELVVLQELHCSQYFCQTEDSNHFDLAETIPGPTTETLSNIAQQLNIVLVSSLFENRGNGMYHNTAVVFEKNGSIAGKYRKMHIPDDPGYYEKYYFTPGDLGFQPINTSLGKLGVLVCWDQWFPEAARLMALHGADILIYPTAIGFAPEDDEQLQQTQLDAWITIQRSHSIANSLPVVSCNRVGFEADLSEQTSGIAFWGNSFITGHQGEILKQASTENEEIIIADIDFNQRDEIQRVWPYFRDRRIDAYKDITKLSGES